jgi:drug/metabolite transporter (DMT)-like permease
MSDTLRAILLMVVAMAAFAVEDMFIKLASPPVPQGQVLLMMGLAGLPVFAALARWQGMSLFQPGFFHPAVLARNLGEMVGTTGFIMAITLVPLTTASAVFQAMPLAVTAGAALFLGERVGWRRWSAISFGFAGVLVVLRPGLEGFEPAALWAVLAVVGLGARDLFTRMVPKSVPSMVLSGWAFVAVAAVGAIMLAVTGGAVWPDGPQAGALLGALVLGIGAYLTLTMALRTGDVSAVMPFRYSRLIFALLIGALVFGERPDALTYVGMAMILGAGLYTILRERALSKAARSG